MSQADERIVMQDGGAYGTVEVPAAPMGLGRAYVGLMDTASENKLGLCSRRPTPKQEWGPLYTRRSK